MSFFAFLRRFLSLRRWWCTSMRGGGLFLGLGWLLRGWQLAFAMCMNGFCNVQEVFLRLCFSGGNGLPSLMHFISIAESLYYHRWITIAIAVLWRCCDCCLGLPMGCVCYVIRGGWDWSVRALSGVHRRVAVRSGVLKRGHSHCRGGKMI